MNITRSWTLWGKGEEGEGKEKGKRRAGRVLMNSGRRKAGNIWRNYVGVPRPMKPSLMNCRL